MKGRAVIFPVFIPLDPLNGTRHPTAASESSARHRLRIHGKGSLVSMSGKTGDRVAPISFSLEVPSINRLITAELMG